MEKQASNKIRPEKAEPYSRKPYDPEDPELPPDWMALLSLLFGIAGFFMKYKWCSWVAILCSCMSFTNSRTIEFDTKQQLMSFLFAIAGLGINYFGPHAYEIKKAEL